MLFMVIERFKNRDGKAVYRHFLQKGNKKGGRKAFSRPRRIETNSEI